MLHRCPCCRFPTLAERSAWHICAVCWWEDDGQDDPRADEVWGGPNEDYSLSAARANFLSHGHMYDRGQGIQAVERPSPERSSLLGYVRDVLDHKETLDDGKLQRLMTADREARDRD
jgi:cysteine-rich CPCC protein